MKAVTLSAIFTFFALSAFAQKTPDTLSWNQFKTILLEYHPVANQARLLRDIAKARMTQAWGGFEPKVSTGFDEKQFDGTTYYRFLTPEVKLPLWYGLELKGSYSEAEGAYLNPENKLPKEGLSSVGLNMSLGKGLLIDKRRAALKQARIFSEATTNEQMRMMNDLIFTAGESYLNWQMRFKISEMYEQALQLATVRYNAVRDGWIAGDRPAIDTTEALTQVQQRQIQLQQAKLDLQNALYELSAYMWLPDNQPVDVDQLSALPQQGRVEIRESADAGIDQNPKLGSYQFKLRELEIERRLKAENLRPTVDLQLGLLNSGSNALRNINPDFWVNNNKIGVQFAFPLALATARGELREAKFKIRNVELEQSLVRNELTVKLNQNRAEGNTLFTQYQLIRQSLEANKRLLEGEELRFKFGDSSLFLINARESKVLESQEKLIETENKIQKNKLKTNWITGALAN
jgi:outer membrane protein TolC